jgi:hypothetical protein
MPMKTKVGFKGCPALTFRGVDFFEIDALDELFNLRRSIIKFRKNLLGHQSAVILANQYFFIGSDESDRIEKAVLLRERAQYLGAKVCIINAASAKSSICEFKFAVQELSENGISVYLDSDQDKNPQTASIPKLLGVLDPLWDHKRCKNYNYWRVHGWHPERWVRMYSSEALRSLAVQVKKIKPEYLSFAHSQRETQAISFIDHLKALTQD